ncbi:patatin-like phospholipase family protein [Jiella sp. MQZ9-1]|uniref:Patatin-like phospholipase family protein n=1 Tax=Jiella flava TaxID=2816857 RepID=A0A939G1P2_9HYPH|nr:patatin-like phospholipase family protein [Jiella flava]MBO0663404.1 patatin-like phospholipase family protein [Jiella flava]MCD2471980.1 patatin-like phospholipase family protein [Jiella flava]
MLERVFSWREDPPAPTGLASPIVSAKPKPKNGIALALGGGAARGWAHIGVLKALDEYDIPISMIAGTSIGALVGGCYLAGKLAELEEFARSLTKRGLIRYLDFRIGGSGLIGGLRLSKRLTEALHETRIEDLDRTLICVATDAETGHEVWLDSGSLVLAMRASYALPGVFEPVFCGGRRLMDGALVNPVPANVCRVFEQQNVMAVNLHYDLFGRAAVLRMRAVEDDAAPDAVFRPVSPQDEMTDASQRRKKLGLTRTMVDAFNIIQDRISRARLAGDPPDLSLQPRVRDIGLWEFFRAAEAIEIGYSATKSRISEIHRLAESDHPELMRL